MKLLQPETTRKKARARARDLGHRLVNFRKRKLDGEYVAWCLDCKFMVITHDDDFHGAAVTQPCFNK